jgi:hypothetical protein
MTIWLERFGLFSIRSAYRVYTEMLWCKKIPLQERAVPEISGEKKHETLFEI